MPLFGVKKEPERQPAGTGIRKPSGVTSGQTQQMIRERGTKQGASSSASGGISWKDYNRYEQDYNGWKTTGQHGADFGSWATDSGLQSWKSIRDRAKTGAQAALIGDTYHVLDKDTYDRYEKDYSYWKKHGKHTADFDTWADQGQLDTWRTIRDYNIGVKAGTNPSMELQSTINGLDPDVLKQVQETYRSSWKYGTTDEDLVRKAQGLPPKSKDKYYKGGSEFDQWLYGQGLPSTKSDYFQQLYDAAAEQVRLNREAQGASGAAAVPAVRGRDLSAEQAKAIAEAFRSDWSYASSTEDKARKRGGRMPKSVEAMYQDTEEDRWNRAHGLPPASLIADYMGVQAGNAEPAAAAAATGKKTKAEQAAGKAASTGHIDFTGREDLQNEIAELFREDWEYANTPEDKARKRAGRPPKKVEDEYTDTETDRWYKKNGLPPASMIDAYMPQQGDMAAMVSDPMRAIREAGTRPAVMPTQEDLLDAVTGGEAPAAGPAEAAPEKTQAERYAENARDRGVRREILERQGVPEDILDAVYGPDEKPAADQAGAPDEIDAVTGASEYGERSAGEAPAEESGEAAGPGKWGDLIGERYVPGREPMSAPAWEGEGPSDLLDREPGSAERTQIGTAEPEEPERAALGRNIGPTVRKAQAGPVRMAQKQDEDTQLLTFLQGQKDAGVSRDEIEAYDTDGMFGQDLLDAVFGEEPAAPQGAPDPYAARPYSVDEEWWNALVDEAVSERDAGHDRQWVEDSDQWNDPTSQAVLDAVFGQKSAEQADFEREAAKARQEAIEQEKAERRARMADASAWAEEDAAIATANMEATYASEMGIDPSLYGTPEELAQRNLDPNAPSTAPDFLYSADGLPASQLDERIAYIDKYLAKIYEETPRTPWEVLHGLSEGEAGATIADLEAQKAKLQAMAASARSTEAVEESAKLYAAVSQRPDWQDGSAPIPYEEIGSYARTRDERNILKVFDGISPWEEGRDAREQELDEYGPRVDGKYASVYYMSDGERGVFRYLARTQSMDAAMEYVDRLLPALNARSYEETAEIAAYASEHHPILTTLWNVTGGQLISAGEGIVTGISALANDMTDGAVGTRLVENDPRLRATAAKQMTQAQIRKQIVETSGSETWGMVYDLAASIAENGVRAALFGGAPGGQIMSATTMYGQVFASTVYEYMNEKHADYKTAIFAGLLDAGAEALGEAVDFGAWLSMKSELKAGKATGRMIAQYMMKNVLTEGGSEAITSVTEKAIDYLLMQDDSEMAKLWQETYEQTGDRTEAWNAVLWTAGKDALIEGVSGAISGVVLAGGNVVYNRMRYGSGAGRATMIAGLTEGTNVNTDAAIAGDYIERAIREGGANMSADERMAMLHEIRGMANLTEAQKDHFMDLMESFGSLPQSMTSDETKAAITDVKTTAAQSSMKKAEVDADAQGRVVKKRAQLQTKLDRVQAAAAQMEAAPDPATTQAAAAQVQAASAEYQREFDQAQAEEQAAQQKDRLKKEQADAAVQQKLARLESMADREAGHFDEQLEQAAAAEAAQAGDRPVSRRLIQAQMQADRAAGGSMTEAEAAAQLDGMLDEIENAYAELSEAESGKDRRAARKKVDRLRSEFEDLYGEAGVSISDLLDERAASQETEQGVGRVGEERREIEADRATIEREYQRERDALEVRQDEAEMEGNEQAVREIESEINELDDEHRQLMDELDARDAEKNGGTYGEENENLGADDDSEAGGGQQRGARTADESEDQGYGREDQGAAPQEGNEQEVIPQAPFTEQQAADIRSMTEDLARAGRAVADGMITPAQAVSTQMQAALDTLSRITGVGRTVVYDSADANVPAGFTMNGRTYAMNTADLLYNAGHEHAHNMPAVIGAVRTLLRTEKVARGVFDAYLQARKQSGAMDVDYAGAQEEFAADVTGAILNEAITGDKFYENVMREKLGMTDDEFNALQDAVYDSLGYDPEKEITDEDALSAALGGEQRQEGVRYSGNVVGSETAQRDAEYMSAVESGDMETAQRMVDEAARRAGYGIRAYHGSDAEERFRVFRPGERGEMWFASTSETSYNNRAQNYDVYLKIENPYEVSYGTGWNSKFDPQYVVEQARRNGHDGAIVHFRIMDEYKQAAQELLEIVERAFPDMLATDEFVESISYLGNAKRAAREGELLTDYIRRGLNEGFYDWYVTFKGSQIKSADPVTYHPDGTPVDLSERFNRGESDINYSGNVFGREEQNGQQGDLLDAAVPVYDITPNGRSEELAEQQGSLLDAALEPAPAKTDAEKRAERKARDKANRKRRQQEKARQEREAAERRRIEEGLFAEDPSMESMEARTQRSRLTDEAGLRAKELNELIDNLTGQFETPTEKTPNPKDVRRVARRILKNETGATMSEGELAERLDRITRAYRNNEDRSAADEDLLDAAQQLATDIVDSVELSIIEETGEDPRFAPLIDLLRKTPIKVGPRGRKQLKDAFGSLKEFRAAVGNDSILHIQWVDSDSQSTFEDIGGMINGYLDEDVRQLIDEAFGGTNTIDIVELAEFVQAERLGEHDVKRGFRDLYGDSVYTDEVAEVMASIIGDVAGKGIGNQATYAQRGARAMADVGRDLGRIRELAEAQLESIRGIRDAGNREAEIASKSAFRARQAYKEAYQRGRQENAELAERNARLNAENERLARNETALEERANQYGREARDEEGIRALRASNDILNRQASILEWKNDRLNQQMKAKEERFAKSVKRSGEAIAKAQSAELRAEAENERLRRENIRLGTRERTRQERLRKADELFQAGMTARDYYEQDPQAYDHEVARQLNGMRLRNGEDVGGRINTPAFDTILERSEKYAPQKALPTSLNSPVRVFEDVAGRYSSKNSNAENARIYRDRQQLKDAYYEYGNKMMSDETTYVAEKRAAIEQAWTGHGKTTGFDSAAVQLLGEGVCTEDQIRKAVTDGRTMVVNGLDGTFVFRMSGHGRNRTAQLWAFSDSDSTYVYPTVGPFGKRSDKPVKLDGALIVNRDKGITRVTDMNGTVYADIAAGAGKGLNMDAVKATAGALRSYYDEAYDAINRVRVENGYAPIRKAYKYFPHIGRQETGMAGFIQQMKDANLPASINGITETFRPGQAWAAHMQERLGAQTEYDAIRGFDAYVQEAGDQIYRTPVIQRLRQLENGLRRSAGRSDQRNSVFVEWLNKYANAFANKKAAFDREAESIFGRMIYKVTQKGASMFSGASVGGNISSGLSNMVSWMTGAARINPASTLEAAGRQIAQGLGTRYDEEKGYDGFIRKIPYLNRAFGDSESIRVYGEGRAKTLGGKLLYGWFGMVDRFAKESMGRAYYDKCMKQGMSEAQAVRKTDDFLIKNFADRGVGQAAKVFGIKWLKPFSQFQLEVLNQQYHFRDIDSDAFERRLEKVMREYEAEDPTKIDWDQVGKKLYAGRIAGLGAGGEEIVKKMAYLALLSLWGAFTRYALGRDQSWNVVGTGQDIARNIRSLPKKEQNLTGYAKAVGSGLWSAAEENLPVVSMLNGGRVPMLGGLDTVTAGVKAQLPKALGGEREKYDSDTDRWLATGKGVLQLIPGGGQLSKTVRGLTAVSRGGQYNAKGTRLQFPVAQTPGNWARGLAFGPSAMQPEGYDFEKDVLPEEKTEAFKEATSPDYGMDPEAAYTILHGYDGSTNASKSLSLAAGIIESGAEDPDGTFDLLSSVLGYKHGEKRGRTGMRSYVEKDYEERKAALAKGVADGSKTQEQADAELEELDRYWQIILGE